MRIIFTILFIASPLFLGCGFLLKKKAPAQLLCFGILFVLAALFRYDYFFGTYPWVIGYEMDPGGAVINPAFYYITKLLSMIIPDYRGATVIWSFFAAAGVVIYINKYSAHPVLAAITAVVSGLWLINFKDPCLFMAILLSAFSFRYAAEKRFVRFAALILFSACFELEFLLLIPLYFIFFTKPTLYHIIVFAVMAGLLLFFDISPAFGFIGSPVTARTGADLFYPVTIAVTAVVTALAARITIRRNPYNASMVTVMGTAAALALGSVADVRLLPLAIACFFPAAITLVPETVLAAKSIIALTFKERKKTFITIGGIVLSVLAAIYYAVIIFRPETAMGYETWIGMRNIF